LRILVVGGAGFVGSTSVEAFVDAGHDVVVYDDLSSGHASAVVRPARLVRGQIEDQAHLEHVLRDDRIEAVLQCAAKSIVGESLSDPGLY
jgi:UDP-glucose 4-epimerase